MPKRKKKRNQKFASDKSRNEWLYSTKYTHNKDLACKSWHKQEMYIKRQPKCKHSFSSQRFLFVYVFVVWNLFTHCRHFKDKQNVERPLIRSFRFIWEVNGVISYCFVVAVVDFSFSLHSFVYQVVDDYTILVSINFIFFSQTFILGSERILALCLFCRVSAGRKREFT